MVNNPNRFLLIFFSFLPLFFQFFFVFYVGHGHSSLSHKHLCLCVIQPPPGSSLYLYRQRLYNTINMNNNTDAHTKMIILCSSSRFFFFSGRPNGMEKDRKYFSLYILSRDGDYNMRIWRLQRKKANSSILYGFVKEKKNEE